MSAYKPEVGWCSTDSTGRHMEQEMPEAGEEMDTERRAGEGSGHSS